MSQIPTRRDILKAAYEEAGPGQSERWRSYSLVALLLALSAGALSERVESLTRQAVLAWERSELDVLESLREAAWSYLSLKHGDSTSIADDEDRATRLALLGMVPVGTEEEAADGADWAHDVAGSGFDVSRFALELGAVRASGMALPAQLLATMAGALPQAGNHSLADTTDSHRTTTLWRPCNDAELALVADSGWRRWPPRLDWQPIFYPVLNEQYAVELATGFQAPAFGVSHVTSFEVDSNYLAQFDVQCVGDRTSLEYWIPAERLEEFNDHIVGQIEVVATFGAEA